MITIIAVIMTIIHLPSYLIHFVDGLDALLCEFLQTLKVDHDIAKIAIALVTINVTIISAWSI